MRGLLMVAFVAGCCPNPPTLTAGPACPALTPYTQEQRAALAEEVDHLPPGFTSVPAALVDYAALRAACRRG